jgi:YesN/AraC family two-component response regulator
MVGTRQFNEADKVAKNRQAKGEHNGKTKLTQDAVIRMRYLRAKGLTYDELAEHFAVERTTVAQVVRRKTWRHVA